ncbi:MAG TPA: FkbM family methyltransferase [Candidatus Dormibacteraeota bacterium]
MTAADQNLSLGRYLSRPGVRRDPLRMLSRRVLFEAERRFAPSRLRRLRSIAYAGTMRLEVDLSHPKERTPYLCGLPEYASATTFLGLLRPGMNVVDAGANVGEYTLLAAQGAGPTGRVLAVEPNPLAAERLRRNLNLNRLDTVTVAACAVGRVAGAATLSYHPEDLRTGRILELVGGPEEAGMRQQEVPMRPLADLVSELGWDRIDAIKVDVEGAEADALQGAADLIEASRPAILFEVNGIRQGADGWRSPAIDWLRRRGYRLFSLSMDGTVPRRRELEPGSDPRPRGEPGSATNLLALHPQGRAEDSDP